MKSEMNELSFATNIIHSQFTTIIKERDELKRENYKLRQEIRHLKKKRSNTLDEASPNKRNSFPNLFTRNDSSSSDSERESGSPRKKIFNLNQINRLKRAYNDTTSKVSTIVSSKMGFSQSSTALEQLDSLGRHSDCITDISIIDSICASGSFDRTCKIWNLKDRELIQTYTGHSGSINSVSLHPSCLVLTGSGDTSVHLCDYNNATLAAKYFHQSYVASAQFLDTDKIISSSVDGSTKIFNVLDEHIERDIKLNLEICCLTPCPYNRNYAALGATCGLIQVVDLRETQSANNYSLFDENLREKINSIVYPTENHIITSSNDKNIRIWDKRNGRVVFKQQINDGVNKLYSSNGRLSTVALDSKRIAIIKYENQKLKIQKFSVETEKNIIAGLDTDTMVLGGWSNMLSIYKHDF